MSTQKLHHSYRYDDETKITFGVHNQTKLIDLEEDYLQRFWYANKDWYLSQSDRKTILTLGSYYDRCRFRFMEYIEENIDDL